MKRLPIIFVVLSLPLYLLDQVTKWWVVFRFREPLSNDFHTPDEHVAVIDGFLWWWRIHNQGAAFGLGNGTSWAPFVFLLVLIFALVLIFVFWRKGAFANRSARLAAALLVAGVLGNFESPQITAPSSFPQRHLSLKSLYLEEKTVTLTP
ncbi:signal peptidase II [Akkermansiaceae bacterium]|nr:signal peptidase II [Akkermansiaceae bacterium]